MGRRIKIMAFASDGLFSKMGLNERHQLIGEITSLLVCSPLHRKYLVDDIGVVFFPAIDLNQFRIYKVNQRPVALITWANLTKPIEYRYLAGDYTLKRDDWNGGDRTWIIDFLAPFGHTKQVAHDLKYNVFPHRSARSIRVDFNGNVRGTRVFHGCNVAKGFRKKAAGTHSEMHG